MASNIGLWGRFAILGIVSFFFAACDGSDGAPGAAGPIGPAGPPGPPPPPDPVAEAIAASKVESCATCHGGVGEEKHQAIYDKYVDVTTLALMFDNLTSADNGNGTFTVTLTFSIAKNGAPVIDVPNANGLPSFDQERFEAVTYNSATREYLNECRLRENWFASGGGQYTVQDTNCSYAPEQQVGALGAHVYGYVAQGALLEHAGGSGAELPAGSHVHLYDDVASAALAYGTAVAGSAGAYESMANVAGCEKCHGQPYLKHGYRDPIVASLPDFASCKSCHYDDRNGGHEDWQYMVDDPFNWATAGLPNVQVEATYAYKAKLMNDVHMAHAMEFPYPQSMSNCATCHEGKLNQVLANTNFTPETCMSCHPVQGTDAWPGETYAQGHRAPALEYLWTAKNVQGFHNPTLDCQQCHGSVAIPTALPFDKLHTGYDVNITNANGEKYSDLYTVSIDQITRSGVNGELLTVNFSANEPAIVPEVLVSFYGWDSRNFLIPSHARDGSTLCTSRGNPTGCRMEFAPGNVNPLFTEDAASVPGDWMVTLDMAAFQAAETADILTLIANGDVKKVEITLTPELNLADIGGADVDVVLNAVGQTFDLGASMVVNDYFKGANATVDTNKCDVCHDSLASSFHDGRGRGGGGIQVCKNCHNPTFTGSHVEMASRSIDNYVHAIHSFQDFDPGDTFEVFDPVLAKRYDQHINHVFPNFTIRNCEACHLSTPLFPVTYNVPDQSKSMPGAQSVSDNPLTWYEMVNSGGLIPSSIAVEDSAGRNIGFVPEVVVGPASRACGGCHRARNINDDLAGDLASFNAHTEAGGTFVENDAADTILFGIIDKIMSLFE